jgi:predicted outer membrane repeat protein
MNAAETVTAQFSANLVVNLTTDDNPGVATNCVPQASSGVTSTADACSLRDALAFAANAGAASITFDSTVFSAGNSVAANTISLGSAGVLVVPANTSITGPTSGAGYTLANLVTVSGAGASGVFHTGTGAETFSNLAIVNGYSGDGGGLFNDHGVVLVANCTFANNTATEWGGGIFSWGTTTVTGSTFSGNSAASYGGGLMNYGGVTTITNSTFNSNSSSSQGGGIFNNDETTVVGSTLYGNSATAGGGVFWSGGTNIMANSIVTGNSAPSHADTNGFTDNGGNHLTTGFALAPLGSSGGPTQTMLPLPGDPSLCGGTLANATAAGLAADQRGFPFDPHCPAGLVDSGAVQTNYALGFSALLFDYIEGTNFSPTLTLYESGAPASAANGQNVTLSDTGATLTGTLTRSLVAGRATFSNLAFSTLGLTTKLMATMSLNPVLPLNLIATAGEAITSSPVPAVISSPATSAILPGPGATFTWNTVTGATGYSLWIGTAGVGSNNIYVSGETSATSLKIGNLPTNGATVYVRLYTNYFGVATSNDYVYTASTQAALKTPSSPGVLAGAKVTFTWSAATGSGVTGYSLWLGSTQGASNLYTSGETTALSATATKLPTNSSTVWARIYTNYNGAVRYTDYTYTAAP